eukprot:9982074-Lingulodinium_polyedra.AAC.1
MAKNANLHPMAPGQKENRMENNGVSAAPRRRGNREISKDGYNGFRRPQNVGEIGNRKTWA